MTIRDYSTTPGDNDAAPPNGWPEGQAASTVNDCGRQMMAEIRETFEEAPYFDFGDDPTRVDNDTFTLVGDLTARYPVGNRVKLVGATTGFGRITSSVFGAVTTIDVVMDSGNVPLSLVRVAVQPTATFGTINFATLGSSALAVSPTWTEQHTFAEVTNAAAAFVGSNSNSAGVRVFIGNTSPAADNRYWGMRVNENGDFRMGVWSDANFPTGSETANFLAVERTGTAVDRVTFQTDSSGAFVVGTSGSVINSARAQFRTASAAATVQVSNATSGQYNIVSSNEQASGDNAHILFTEGITTRGSITYNRGGGVIAYNTSSDVRLKENIRDSDGALSLILSIRVRAFDWKNMPGSAQRYWLVAQELAEVMPEAVTIPDKDEDSWSLDASKLVPLTLKGVQEQQGDIDELRAQLQALIARVSALEGVRAGTGGK